MDEQKSHYWLEPILDSIEAKFPDGEIVVSSGISPSANYHIGHFSEILSADMITSGLKLRGRQAVHKHVVDNFDPLRKRYPFLPEEYEKYVGWPISLIPAPDGSDQTYADYFFERFHKYVREMNLDHEVVKSYEDLYSTGKMAGQIEAVLNNMDKIKAIFKEVSNREVEADWTPVQVLGEDNKFFNANINSWDPEAKTIEGIKLDEGRVKLNWRLDWPARWQVLGVNVEPHSWQEHGAAGGSYETGVRFSNEIYNFDPPMPAIQYGNIHLKGDNIKMSSSKNNLITPAQAFEIMPPSAIRYFYARYLNKKRVDFDPALGLARLLDEFSKVDQDIRNGVENEFAPAYKLATYGQKDQAMSSIPFTHLVSAYQASLGDNEKLLAALKRSEYKDVVDDQKDLILSETVYVKNWLENFAPDELKFEVQAKLPEAELTDQQKEFLAKLASEIEAKENLEGQDFHNLIYETKEAVGIEPSDAFKAIYRVILGKDSGPKAGWFLSILERDFLIKRFKLVD